MLNIDIWDILWTVINLLILFALLKKFLFKPVIRVMEKRESMINEDIEKAKNAKEEAEAVKQKYETELAGISAEADKITEEAVARAQIRSGKIISEAKADADKMIAQARETAQRERTEAIESAKEEIADLAVMAAARIMEKNIDEQSNLVYARELLDEVGGADE